MRRILDISQKEYNRLRSEIELANVKLETAVGSRKRTVEEEIECWEALLSTNPMTTFKFKYICGLVENITKKDVFYVISMFMKQLCDGILEYTQAEVDEYYKHKIDVVEDIQEEQIEEAEEEEEDDGFESFGQEVVYPQNSDNVYVREQAQTQIISKSTSLVSFNTEIVWVGYKDRIFKQLDLSEKLIVRPICSDTMKQIMLGPQRVLAVKGQKLYKYKCVHGRISQIRTKREHVVGYYTDKVFENMEFIATEILEIVDIYNWQGINYKEKTIEHRMQVMTVFQSRYGKYFRKQCNYKDRTDENIVVLSNTRLFMSTYNTKYKYQLYEINPELMRWKTSWDKIVLSKHYKICLIHKKNRNLLCSHRIKETTVLGREWRKENIQKGLSLDVDGVARIVESYGIKDFLPRYYCSE